ncbi:MAG: NUDIX domain-containing protein [Anaerolineales bacterium]|nr:NUDIX domain-containing protein [Anaerolineales bacterium]
MIPRTLSFLLHDDEVLLIRLAADREGWAGKYNGVGGHIEKGEDPRSAALREIFEETGLTPSTLKLCGVITIDLGETPGIGLYVFVGDVQRVDVNPGSEGVPQWVILSSTGELPLVEDLPQILPKSIEAFTYGSPFSAQYSYDDANQLKIEFS